VNLLGGCQLAYQRVAKPLVTPTLPAKERHMSGIDKMKNKAEELSGKGKEALGEATDDRDLQAEGQKDQAKGNLKQAGEKVKDVFK
jgi:uncharacterized protein YjbJ (UPF0337 family)